MKRIMMAAVLWLAAFGMMTPVASAAFIYEINRSVARESPAAGGTISVVGTITVSGLGVFTTLDAITDYSLTFTSPQSPTFTLTPANGVISGMDFSLVATSTSLSFNLPALDSFLHFDNTVPPPNIESLNFFAVENGPGLVFEFVSNGLIAGAMADQGETTLGPIPGPYLLGIAAVPEPSSMILLASGLGAVALFGRRLQNRGDSSESGRLSGKRRSPKADTAARRQEAAR